MAYDKKLARQILERVLERLEESSESYGDLYLLNDIPREVEEELYDLVGWPLMQAVRIVEALRGRVTKLDKYYWETFLPKQTTEFLKKLQASISLELWGRGARNESQVWK